MTQQKITTFLWFDGKAEEAVSHYVSIFEGSRIVHVSRYGKGGPGPEGGGDYGPAADAPGIAGPRLVRHCGVLDRFPRPSILVRRRAPGARRSATQQGGVAKW